MDEDMVPGSLGKRDGGEDSAFENYVGAARLSHSLQINCYNWRTWREQVITSNGISTNARSCRPLKAPYWADVSEVKRLLHTSCVHDRVPAKRNAPPCFQGSCSVIAMLH